LVSRIELGLVCVGRMENLRGAKPGSWALGGPDMAAVDSLNGQGILPTRELFDQGLSAYASGDPASALEYLRCAYRQNDQDARMRSYYGLCLGLAEKRFEESVELCQSAAKQEFFNPELYHNLAMLHLGFGFKAEAVRFLRRGLMIDPGNQTISTALRELGDRMSPVLNFLPRRHPVNRWLGAARHVLARNSSWAM
jgi:tetratricopeptide (TPR) repeat protein